MLSHRPSDDDRNLIISAALLFSLLLSIHWFDFVLHVTSCTDILITPYIHIHLPNNGQLYDSEWRRPKVNFCIFVSVPSVVRRLKVLIKILLICHSVLDSLEPRCRAQTDVATVLNKCLLLSLSVKPLEGKFILKMHQIFWFQLRWGGKKQQHRIRYEGAQKLHVTLKIHTTTRTRGRRYSKWQPLRDCQSLAEKWLLIKDDNI